MKTIKHLFVIVFIISGSVILTNSKVSDSVFIMLALFIIILFITNLFLRKNLTYKYYFMSKYNFLTSKYKSKQAYDISKKLMFEKVIEVIKHSNFVLTDIKKDTSEILAISPMSLISWGENLYIRFESTEDKTMMYFCSTSFFLMYSWGKNEGNYKKLLNNIEDSLTI